MTLVVALACKDGIVMASDSQASNGMYGQETQKLFNLGGGAVAGITGDVGMLEKYIEVLKHFGPYLSQNGLTEQIRYEIRMQIAEVTRMETQIFRTANPEGPMRDYEERQRGGYMLIAVRTPDGKRRIWGLSGDHDIFLEDIGKGAIATGSGEIFGLTALNKFEVNTLSLSEAKVLAYKAIIETENMAAVGVGGKIVIWVMNKDGRVEQMSKDDMSNIENAYLRLCKEEKDVMKSPAMTAHFKHMEEDHKNAKTRQQTVPLSGLGLPVALRTTEPIAVKTETAPEKSKAKKDRST